MKGGVGEERGEGSADEQWDQRKKGGQKDRRLETLGKEMTHENILGKTMRQKCRRELGRDRKGKKSGPRKRENLGFPGDWLLCYIGKDWKMK